MDSQLKVALKRARAWPPFNRVATSSVRCVLSAFGIQSEFVIRHLHRAGTVRVRLPNGRMLRLWSRGDDWVSNQIYWRGWSGYEPETVPLFFRLATSATTVLDVGAYVGYYTLLAAHANPKARVCAFEPLPSVHARLTRNVALNGLGNVVCVPCAVGDVDGDAEFFHTPYELPTSSSLSQVFMGSGPDLRRSTVPVVTLERFAREQGLGRIDLVKIDTESTEPQVLKGMGEILARDHPTLLCEVLAGRGSEQALEDLLAPHGYCFYLLTPDGPAPRTHVEGHPEFLNYLFTPLGPEEVARL